MLDFHTHILPAMDDGSKNAEQSVLMLMKAQAHGIREVIATPHFYATDGDPASFLARRAAAYQRLLPHLTAQMPAIRLGAEVQYFEGITSVTEMMDLRIVGSTLLLLEMPMLRWTPRMVEDIRELNNRKNLRIVLAHIDRYRGLLPRGMIESLSRDGVLMQVNASFFIDFMTRGTAKRMLRNGTVQFVGSDMHNLVRRPPNWDKIPPKLFAEIEDITAENAAGYFK